ncbi:hypothetical protein, unlikely [Trypanosoma brucei gambiense DAL972]|uniref:Uncharacterized protein n=1 Tax=Trypanosoma brucei gambiense (strain MHOM/CI/86/DAL972) TaxID=679716 RepID=D0A7R9_TRYB9|nr:hypothetical protein, unlikely [Trypanosoma brucei gambiense DAL972]CBH17720.1 hypothetical protein, unlikely [Trypanosoma brucei gambiense DAL972]|eukprot:XP_011779984.1 hypothetical protein, unlikely [Trypanosoma brucei gambiense DAL972]
MTVLVVCVVKHMREWSCISAMLCFCFVLLLLFFPCFILPRPVFSFSSIGSGASLLEARFTPFWHYFYRWYRSSMFISRIGIIPHTNPQLCIRARIQRIVTLLVSGKGGSNK